MPELEVPTEKPEVKVPELTLTREQAEELAQAKVDEALAAYRVEQDEKTSSYEAQLAATRKELHERTVKEKVAELVAAGHSPAVITKAQEFMLADGSRETSLSLTREDEEVKLSATDIVSELLASIPATALTATSVATPDTSKLPEDGKARADAIYEELFGPDAAPAVSLS